MSDAASQVQAGPPPAEPRPPIAAPPAFPVAPPRPRLWPAVAVVVLLQLAVWLPGWLDAPGMMRYMFVFFGPMIAAAGLAVWWLFFSRVRWIDRGLGLAAFAAGAAVAVYLSLLNPPMLLIVFALPVVLTVWVLVMLTTLFLPWSFVRVALPVALLLSWAAYTCVRFDGLYSDLHGTLLWRWTNTDEEKFLTTRKPSISRAPGATALKLQPGDWAGFRGPQRDGRLTGVRIAADWTQNPPRELWRHRVGPAWSSFAVVGDCLFTQEQRGTQESVVCYDAASGKEVWAHNDATRFDEAMGGAGPRTTPTFHDGKVYALGAKGRLNCLDAATGEVVWSRDVAADSGATVPIWGFSSSPLMVGDVVTVIAAGSGDKSVLGYDAASGNPPVWSAAAGKMSYSSPHPAKLGGVEQVLCATEAGLTAFDAKGAVLWKYDWPQAMHRVVQPTIVDDSDLLISSFTETRRIHVHHEDAGWKAEDVWASPSLKPNFNDMVVYNGYVYGYDADTFECVNLEDGRMKWRTKAYGGGQVLLLADQGVLLVQAESGAVVLVKASPDKREELGQVQALEGKTWNHPVVAHGKLFVRNAAWAACYQLTEEGK